MKNRHLFVLVLFVTYLVNALCQPPDARYSSALFTGTTETSNVLFSSNVPRPNPGGGFYETITGLPLNVDETRTTNVNLHMNIFQPIGDTLTKRPVVIICFGGGFIDGNKDILTIRLLAQDLAKRGFVTAVMDYRLGMNIFDSDLSKRAVYRGIQDGRSAVRFFKADAAGVNAYKVDPDQIYLGGHSSGAFIATHNAYLDIDSLRPASTRAYTRPCGFFSTCSYPDLGTLDGVGDNKTFSGKAKAVFSLAGAIGELRFMDYGTGAKMAMFHSTDDGTVPFDSGQPFSSVSGFILGFDLPTVYGSNVMSNKANTLNIPHEFNSYTNRGHGVHEASSTMLHGDIVPKIANYFYINLLKPVPHIISGRKNVCEADLHQTYTTLHGQAKYYKWEVEGGVFTSMSMSSSSCTVEWSSSAPTRKLRVTPYSIHDAKGDMQEIIISIAPSFNSQWVSDSGGNWNNPMMWSLGMVPDPCHTVTFSNSTTMREIIILPNLSYEVKSVTLGNNNKVTIKSGSSILVK